MRALSFLHQKGGTGKSTLAIATALALTGAGHRVVLLDADYQGTVAEWGNRFGAQSGVRTESHVQPDLHEHLAQYGKSADRVIVDGPPALSPMTESILRASARVVIPVRPALPDLWALPWLAALIKKLRAAGQALEPLVVVNMYRGEPLETLQKEIAALGLPLHDTPIPADPAFPALFEGRPPPPRVTEQLLRIVE